MCTIFAVMIGIFVTFIIICRNRLMLYKLNNDKIVQMVQKTIVY
jgi:hypothetical protein